ncbi:MAG: hypothetical protein Q4Q06_02935 [Bacteroidota bacterium]|nr:hypothetical protein [Bacteroidota bacterium]
MKRPDDYFARFLHMPKTDPISGRGATPLTQSVQSTLENPDTEELDVFDVEKQVKVCRPDNAPLDQLIRMESNSRPTKSQVFEFWSATQNDGKYTLSSNTSNINSAKRTTGSGNDIPDVFQIELANEAYDLLPDDVLACGDITANGFARNYKNNLSRGNTPTTPLILQVVEKVDGKNYKVIVVNGDESTNSNATDLAINDKTFFRIGTAKNEEDVLSEAFNLMPKKDGNFAQRYMKVVSESDYQAMIEKEANWGLEQYRSASMYAHRMEVELSQFIGQRRKITQSSDKGDVYFTGGFDDFLLDNVITHNLNLSSGSPTVLTLQDVQEWGRRVFSNSNGGQERYMFVSPLFMQQILNIPQLMTANNTILRVTDAMDLKGQKLGFSIRKLDTGYGIINLVMHKALAGRRDYRGYIIDITNIRRRVLQSAIAKRVDLEAILKKKAKAIILEECCGLEIQNIDTMLLVDLT